MVALLAMLPPAPVQRRVYVLVDVGETDSEPLVALIPDHDPEAVQDVAFVLLQVNADDCPFVIAEGLAERETVGVRILACVVAPTTLLHPLTLPAASTART